METIMVFTDGSVNTKTKTGFGACLIVTDEDHSIEEFKKDIRIKKIENTTSVKLEIQTLIWALSKLEPSCKKIIIYTDSQNIAGLKNRRKRLEENNYRSKNNRIINNAEFYREFYWITDCLDCEIKKVKGHQQSKQKDKIAGIFTLVDRAARKAVRNSGKKDKINL
ncbi:MAG: hypothetical protein JXR31_13820 [Prolixibacteraceae bacterium]|nr:hypothetical protein [Prolixibacteraceae bacterium]